MGYWTFQEESAAVWHYGSVAAIFRDDRVIQLIGGCLEEDGIPRERPELAREDLISNLVVHEIPVLTPPGQAPFRYRLVPHVRSFSPLGRLIRNRLSRLLGGEVRQIRQRSFELSLPQETCQRATIVGEFVEAKYGLEFTWNPPALRRALWECLHFGDDYLRMGAGRIGWHRSSFIIATRSDCVQPHDLRCRLVAESLSRRASQLGDTRRRVIVLDEIEEHDCWTAWERLALAGEPLENGDWLPISRVERRRVGLLNNGRPSASLRLAAAIAQGLDRRLHARPILYPGPDACFDLSYALASELTGKPGWTPMGPADQDVELDLGNPSHLFHCHLTADGGVLRRYQEDRLAPINKLLKKLKAISHSPTSPWNEQWGKSLPGDGQERDLLSHIERFPHDYGRNLAVFLKKVAGLAAEWIPPDPTLEQGLLAAGVVQILELGLDSLGIPVSESD